jgi:hypothetical protein
MRQKLVQAPVPLGGWDGFLSVCMNYPSSPGTVPAWAAFAWLPLPTDPLLQRSLQPQDAPQDRQ